MTTDTNMQPAKIKIGISTYNDFEYVEMLLQSIRWYTFTKHYDVVVCDDGTPECETKDRLRDVCARYGVTLIEHDQNMGIPATWNHLVESLDKSGEIIVLLNNDVIVPPDWLEVCTHFFEANEDHTNVGSMYWNPVNRVPKEAMRAWLPVMTHTEFSTNDLVSGKPTDYTSAAHGTNRMEARIGHGHGLGRVMAPCGACFAFTRKVWDATGQSFDERIKSFFEEIDFGTRCAERGMVSLGFPYPRPLHSHGATFGANSEALQPGERMRISRRIYREKWSVPQSDKTDFNRTHVRFMSQIPPVTVKYLTPDYDAEPQLRTREDGSRIIVPKLVEVEGTFAEPERPEGEEY